MHPQNSHFSGMLYATLYIGALGGMALCSVMLLHMFAVLLPPWLQVLLAWLLLWALIDTLVVQVGDMLNIIG